MSLLYPLMARSIRVEYAGALYHLTSLGDQRWLTHQPNTKLSIKSEIIRYLNVGMLDLTPFLSLTPFLTRFRLLPLHTSLHPFFLSFNRICSE